MNISQILGDTRAYNGFKPLHAAAERMAEAQRLTTLFSSQRGFSFVRLGDYEVAFLLAAESGNTIDLFSDDEVVSGTQSRGNPGLDVTQAPRLRVALEQADYLDYHECLWKVDTVLNRLALRRAPGTTRNPSHDTSYILPTWLDHEFKTFCQNRRVLFCGAEAPLLEELLKYPEFRQAAAAFWPEKCEAYFLRPRENGRNLARNLDGIKQDVAAAIARWNIDTLFLSLGGGAKILCQELANELGICAIDFGAFLRSLTYSGSDGNRATRASHTIFLYRVPFDVYMDALGKSFPGLPPEVLLAKAHAQLLLEVQEKKVGWSCWSNFFDFGDANLEHFNRALAIYKQRYHHLFYCSTTTKNERAGFLHFCGEHKLTCEGRMFFLLFTLKSFIKSFFRRVEVRE